MRTKVIRIAKCICFCLLVLATVSYLTKLFTPKWLENRWQSAKTNNSFYELEEDSIDVAIVGSSVVAAAVDPYQLYEEYGISSYNMGVMQQPMLGTFCWIKEIMTTQSPEVVVVEVKTAGRVSDKNEADSRKSYDYMRWGRNKLQYAVEYCNSNEEADIFEYLFPLGKYHTRWSALSEDDYDFVAGNDDSLTRGFATLTTKSGVEFDGVKTDSDKEIEYNATNEAYLKRIIELCKENNIEVLLIKTPDSSWSASRYNHIKKIADDFGVDYIDFNAKDLMAELNFDYPSESADSVHLNLLGAKKITSYLGNYMKNNYNLSDYREMDDKNLDEELAIYKKVYDDAMLCMENNVDNYLEKLNNEDYAIGISSGGKFGGSFTEGQIASLKQIGVSDKFFEDVAGDNNVIQILDGENSLYETSENYDAITETTTELLKEGYFGDKVYSIKSRRGGVKMKIGTKDYVVDKSKLNIAVYNKKTGQVAECIALVAGDDGMIKIAR